MAANFHQIGLLQSALGRDGEAFGLFLQAFFLFHRLQALAASQALGDVCKTAGRNPEEWRGWIAAAVEDKETRQQVVELISRELDSFGNEAE